MVLGERQVAVLVVQVHGRARHVRREPLAVGERHHQVLRALPDTDGHGDVGEVEAPRPDEREVVVPPAGDAVLEGLVEAVGEVVGDRAGQHRLVDLRHQAAERRDHLVRRDGAQLFAERSRGTA